METQESIKEKEGEKKTYIDKYIGRKNGTKEGGKKK